MATPFVDSGHSKAEALAEAVNTAIHRLILNSMPSGEPWDYYHVGAIGYGDGVSLALGGALEGRQFARISELAEHPVRYTVDDEESEQPIWIEPRAGGGTPMCEALHLATQAVRDWATDYPTSAPPIVLNMTDGVASDGDPDGEAHELTNISTEQGATLLFNLQLTSRPLPAVLFPSNDLDTGSSRSRVLYYMSSNLPEYMATAARSLGIPIADGARGFGCNADLTTLVQFIRLGTTPANAIIQGT